MSMLQIIDFSKCKMVLRQYYYDKIKLKIFIVELGELADLL